MSRRPWTARASTRDDRAVQARLFNVCFRKQKDAATFTWKYDDNPDGPAITRLACDEQGAVVGGYSYMPRRFLRDGVEVTLMQASDAMTFPEWQGNGIFTGLDDIVCEAAGAAGVEWVWAYSGRLSLKGFLRNGWKLIGHAPIWRYRYRSRRGLARLGRLAPLARPLGPALDLLFGWRHRARLALPAGSADLVRIERFDASVDRLFAACAPRTGLVGVRSATWLNWRYIDTPGRRQECWGLVRKGELDGYVVAEFVDGNAYLVDHLARDEPTRALLLQLFTAQGQARGMEEASAILFEHNPAVAALVPIGWRRPLNDKSFRDIFPFIVRSCRPDSAAQDAVMARWQMADGDRDAEHMST